jgi:hypothetical protein
MTPHQAAAALALLHHTAAWRQLAGAMRAEHAALLELGDVFVLHGLESPDVGTALSKLLTAGQLRDEACAQLRAMLAELAQVLRPTSAAGGPT